MPDDERMDRRWRRAWAVVMTKVPGYHKEMPSQYTSCVKHVISAQTNLCHPYLRNLIHNILIRLERQNLFDTLHWTHSPTTSSPSER
jgi:hypothetical protein